MVKEYITNEIFPHEQITDSVFDRVNPELALLKNLLFILIGLVALMSFFILILYIRMPGRDDCLQACSGLLLEEGFKSEAFCESGGPANSANINNAGGSIGVSKSCANPT